MKKKLIILISIILLIVIIILICKNRSPKIKLGYEKMEATSATADIHYQILPQWDYKILADGSVYYRETEGIITRNKFESWKARFEYATSYKYIKRVDKNTLDTIIKYVTEHKNDKKETNYKGFINESVFKDHDYYIYLNDGSNEISLRGETYVDYVKSLID